VILCFLNFSVWPSFQRSITNGISERMCEYAHAGEGRYYVFPAPRFSAQHRDDVCDSNWSEVSANVSGMVVMRDTVISNYGYTHFYSEISDLGHRPIALAAQC
jgi:hypothetical protein